MEHLEPKQKASIMIAVMAAMFFAAINMTIVGTSLPKIIAQIGGMEYFDWVFTVYMLTSTITAMLVGKLSDIYGRKVFILIGIGIFMIGAFLSGTSETIIQLVIYRGIQGLGSGMIMSSAFTTVADLFAPRERGRWQGALGGVFGLSSLFGPTLGGFIVDNYDWHWVFWIFLPIGFVAFAMIWRLYPAHVRQGEKEPVDYLGSFTLTIMIISLLLGFTWAGNEYEWTSVQIIGLFSVTVISLLAFIWIELRAKSPVLPLHLFKNGVFTVSNIAGMLLGMGMFGTIMYVPFYVQGVLGRSATVAGLVEMVMTVSMVLSSILIGNLITKTGKYKIFALTGFVIMATGLFLNSTLHPDSPMWRIIVQLMIVGVGLGMNMPVFNITVQNAVSHKYLGVATAAMQTFRQIGGTIGVAILGSVMGHLMENKLKETAVQPSSAPSPEMEQSLGALKDPQVLMNADKLADIRADLPAEMTGLFDQMINLLKEALNYALTGVFTVSAFIVLAALFTTFFLKELPLRSSNSEKEPEHAAHLQPAESK
ncbi:EmrB/QacA subfamily drug resistance transporter [Bacillus ectoiniformans]|uniref:MDR family MFS transporter n=1 Tax=Bacillus ectoiniformans TaxID=1494429 RepID=UPI00195CB682|nr:MDR family MFS transporter [Bacillus ectoiniformans]MBM7648718.1 EmrB/QacA subfamily drug resistance transporter [Bacillus ectoiniformans]